MLRCFSMSLFRPFRNFDLSMSHSYYLYSCEMILEKHSSKIYPLQSGGNQHKQGDSAAWQSLWDILRAFLFYFQAV